MPLTTQNIAQIATLIIQAKNKDKEIAQRQREDQSFTARNNATLQEKMREFNAIPHTTAGQQKVGAYLGAGGDPQNFFPPPQQPSQAAMHFGKVEWYNDPYGNQYAVRPNQTGGWEVDGQLLPGLPPGLTPAQTDATGRPIPPKPTPQPGLYDKIDSNLGGFLPGGVPNAAGTWLNNHIKFKGNPDQATPSPTSDIDMSNLRKDPRNGKLIGYSARQKKWVYLDGTPAE
jgi:hypothetical protein